MIINAIPLNNCCCHVHFYHGHGVSRPRRRGRGVFMGGLEDKSVFHNLALQPDSWPLFGVHYDGVDYV